MCDSSWFWGFFQDAITYRILILHPKAEEGSPRDWQGDSLGTYVAVTIICSHVRQRFRCGAEGASSASSFRISSLVSGPFFTSGCCFLHQCPACLMYCYLYCANNFSIVSSSRRLPRGIVDALLCISARILAFVSAYLAFVGEDCSCIDLIFRRGFPIPLPLFLCPQVRAGVV